MPVMAVPTKPRHPVEVIHLEDMAGEEGSESSSPLATLNDDDDDGNLFSSTFDNDIQSEIQDLAQSLLRLHDQQAQTKLIIKFL